MEKITEFLNKHKSVVSIIILTISIILGIIFITLFEMKLNLGELSKVRFMFLFFSQKFIEIVLLAFCVGFVYDFLNEKAKNEEENERERDRQSKYALTLMIFKRQDMLDQLSDSYIEFGKRKNEEAYVNAGFEIKTLAKKLEKTALEIDENTHFQFKEIFNEMDIIESNLKVNLDLK